MHVFISYSHDDLDFAQNVRHELERRKIPTWIDELTPAGDDWREEIDTALRGAFAVVLVVTPSAMQSLYVTYEWAFALGAGIAVVPLLRSRTDFHPRIDRAHYLDFTTRARPWDQLAERLHAVREQRSPVTDDNLHDALTSRQATQRLAAVRLLRRLNDPAKLPMLESILFPAESGVNYAPEVRKAAVEAVGNLGEVGLPLLIRALDHRDRGVRYETGSRLVALGEAAVPALIEVLASGGVDARVRVTWVLGEIGSAEAVEALIARLTDRDHLPTYRKRVCDGAADALIAIGTPKALEHAAAYWESQLTSKRKHWQKDAPLSDYAAEKLLLIDTPAARRAVNRWRKEQNKADGDA